MLFCLLVMCLITKSVVHPFTAPSAYMQAYPYKIITEHSVFNAVPCAKFCPSASSVTVAKAVCSLVVSHNDISLENIIKSSLQLRVLGQTDASRCESSPMFYGHPEHGDGVSP